MTELDTPCIVEQVSHRVQVRFLKRHCRLQRHPWQRGRRDGAKSAIPMPCKSIRRGDHRAVRWRSGGDGACGCDRAAWASRDSHRRADLHQT